MLLSDASGYQIAGLSGVPLLVVAIAFYGVAVVWPVVRIIRRAGYSGWWVFAGFIPGINVVLFWFFAFAKWPAQRELEQWRSLVSRMEQARTAPVNAATMGY